MQCCWTRPGNCGLRMTGCLSDVSKVSGRWASQNHRLAAPGLAAVDGLWVSSWQEAVRLMRAMVVAQTPAILERLQIAPGPAAKARPSLVR